MGKQVVVRAASSTDNLCDSCENEFDSCEALGLEFGSGTGGSRDYVIGCMSYAGPLREGKEAVERDITLRQIIRQSRENNKRHDWAKLTVLGSLMLVVAELAEAAECIRDGDMEIHYAKDGKPEGFPVEVGDAIIRLCNITGVEIPEDTMVEAVVKKLEYNFTRPKNHGRQI